MYNASMLGHVDMIWLDQIREIARIESIISIFSADVSFVDDKLDVIWNNNVNNLY